MTSSSLFVFGFYNCLVGRIVLVFSGFGFAVTSLVEGDNSCWFVQGFPF